jgi:thioredoxin 1
MEGRAMMNSISGKATLMALAILCLLALAMTGDCRTAPEGQMSVNASGPAGVFPEAPVAVDDGGLDGALKIYSPFVLDCWEIGCRPCQLIEPKINKMAEDFKGRIVFGKLCVDDNPITMSKYGVSRTPTLLVFKNGSLVYKQVGNYPQDELEHIILTVLHMR